MKTMETKGAVYVITAGFCWGIIGIFTRFLSGCGLDPIQITLIRNLAAALGMLLVILATDREKLKIRLKDSWMFLGTGILSVAFFNICYFKAIEMTTMSVAAILLYTAPAMVVVMSAVFFREKLTVQKIVALLIAFVGCVCTAGMPDETGGISGGGILTGLGAGFGYALYSIFGKIALKRYHPFTVTFYTFFFAAAALLPIGNAGRIAALAQSPRVAAVYGLLGIVSTMVPFLLYTKGLKCIEVGKASVMAYTEPLVATLCGVLFYRERLDVCNVLGILLIFVSMVLLHIPVTRCVRRG